MKRLIAIVLSLCVLLLPLQARRRWIPNSSTAGSFPQGSVFNEDFRTGYQSPNWTTESGSPTINVAPPGTPPVGLPAVSANFVSSGAPQILKQTLPANHTETLYSRFWVYVASDSMSSGDDCIIIRCEDDSTNLVWNIKYHHAGGTSRELYADSGIGTSASISVSAATWYRVILTFNYGGSSSLAVYNSAGTQIGSTATFAEYSLPERIFYLGAVTGSRTIDLTIAGMGIDATGPLNP